MKKICIVLILAVLGLSGCRALDKSHGTKMITMEKNEQQTFKLVGENKEIIAALSTTDNWETAILTRDNGKRYELTRAVSGSGVMLQDKQGNSFHFKGNKGILKLNYPTT